MTQTIHSSQQDQPPEIMCPGCGRFVGPLNRCPNCGARIGKRMSLRVFRAASLLLASAGLFLLYLMATHRELPLIQVGEIKPAMNFAYIRIQGEVTGDPRLFKEGGHVRSIRFNVDDGSGEIPVMAYQHVAQDLVDADLLPAAGDAVEISGSLGVAADEAILLRLQSAKQIRLTRQELATRRLGDITSAEEGRRFLVEGTIASLQKPREGSKRPWNIRLHDASGSQVLVLWPDVAAGLDRMDQLAAGQPVRAKVTVGTYQNSVQLLLGSLDDLDFPADLKVEVAKEKYTAAPQEPVLAAAAVDASMKGRTVVVTGRVQQVALPVPGSRRPVRLQLQDSETSVVYWEDVAALLGERSPVSGAVVRARGEVTVWNDRVDVKVISPSQLAIESLPRPEATPVSRVTTNDLGRTLTVRGSLADVREIKGGLVLEISEGARAIEAPLWTNKWSGYTLPAWRTGAVVEVKGRVKLYENFLQVVPGKMSDVLLLDD